MTHLREINLIHLFDFYLAVVFLVSTYNRISQYRTILGLVRAVPGRWPRLFSLIKQHRMVFMTWTTILPAILACTLSVIHMIACRLIWPQATLDLSQLGLHWAAIPALAISAAAMLGVDWYATFTVGEVNRDLMQGYFDQAEYWLRSWAAPAVHIFTLGYINPRRMVAVEVQKALVEASKLMNTTLWWVNLQVSLRITFGLALWLTYAWTRTGAG